LSCQKAHELINPYVDGELDLVQIVEVEQHLDQCEACNVRYRNQLSLSSNLKDSSLYYRAPKHLRKRIKSSLQEELKVDRQKRNRWAWLILGISFATLLLVGALVRVALLTNHLPSEELLTQEIVSDHIRSLQMSNHLTDVVSSDQHTVKPWFNGKLDFSPPVNDFATEDFHLYGGRLDYLNNRTVATLIYQRRSHYINLYVWPTDDSANTTVTPGVSIQRQGYNLVHWTGSGMNFWLVSDLNNVELRELAILLQQSK
jgi:anti-sigma factor RsiW